jgi:hypothetical protein
MYERYVFIKLQDDHATAPARTAMAQHAQEVLSSLPQVRGLRVGLPAGEASVRSWDLSIALQFESTTDIEAYRVEPAHRTFVDEYLKPRMELMKAWNFELG